MVSPEVVEVLVEARRWAVAASTIVAGLAIVFAVVACRRARALKRALDREHTRARTQQIRANARYDRLRAHCMDNGVDPDARDEDAVADRPDPPPSVRVREADDKRVPKTRGAP